MKKNDKKSIEERLFKSINESYYRTSDENVKTNFQYIDSCIHEAGHLLANIICERIRLGKVKYSSGYVSSIEDIAAFLESENTNKALVSGQVFYTLLTTSDVFKAFSQVIYSISGILFSNEFYSNYLKEYKYSSLEVMSEVFGGKADLESFNRAKLPRFIKCLVVWVLKILYKDVNIRLVHLKLINTLMKTRHVDFRQVKKLIKGNKKQGY